ncbi:MAG TPA: isoleucine--tRNA ligase, partial [Candidatus Andersenbacteria bacterium]|nr:isoleucine--tRNA ligase [Candidatus Andersenbacteria bacterium]
MFRRKKDQANAAASKAFAEAAPRPDVEALEQRILAWWEEQQIFAAALAQTCDKPLFTFYDGPPYATGQPHYGHVLQSALKDTVLRYKTMRGWHVPRIVGWDTHGLPVEVLVEKELGLKTKKDVEQFGVEEFNRRCREAVFRYIDEFTATLKRLGRWADYEHGYATLDRDYMDAEWGVFKQLWEQGLVYQDFRSTPYCIRCETPLSNFEVSMAYKDKADTAVYVLLKVKSNKKKEKLPLYLLIWSTTPWTLPGNVAVAVNKDLHYVSVAHEGREIIVARERVAVLFGEGAEITRTWEISKLLGLTYETPIPPNPPPPAGGARGASKPAGMSRVVLSDHVTADDGAGLVHIAPAFGEEDAQVGKDNDLPTLLTVGPDGRFAEGLPWAGEHIFAAQGKIVADLQARGLLFKAEQYTHSYPFCWRCDQPLIYYALDSWFIRVQALKEKLLAANESISWIPEHIKAGRFAKGIASAPDWAVSRNRYWSVPLPIWRCDTCQEKVCVGSVAELRELSGVAEILDLHRPYVDEIVWPCRSHPLLISPSGRGRKCTGTMRRVPEVLDVWFDSGSMPYATNAPFPADFIVESIEMTRAWFYTLHVLAVALKGQSAFKNVIGSGIIFGEDGNKLSKKLKNYPDIEPTLKKYGADTLRMFFLLSTLGEPYVFSEKELQQLHRNFYLTLWNVYSFFTRYANTYGWRPSAPRSPKGEVGLGQTVLDRWVLARLAQLEGEVIEAMDSYHVDRAARAFVPFVDDVSNWYVRRSRSRFQPAKGGAAEDSVAAFATLHAVLIRLSKLLAPFVPFVTEEIYRNLTAERSIHLTELGEASALAVDDTALLVVMVRARAIVSQALAL